MCDGKNELVKARDEKTDSVTYHVETEDEVDLLGQYFKDGVDRVYCDILLSDDSRVHQFALALV
jgi:hypothetical protein